MIVNIELPIYYTKEYKRPKIVKTKKGTKEVWSKTFLIGMNWYRNAHYHEETEVKTHYHKLVSKALESVLDKNECKYTIRYKLFYKSKVCDAMNIISVIDKYLNDAMQEIGFIKNDNVNFYGSGSWEVSILDKENPRMEIEVEILD